MNKDKERNFLIEYFDLCKKHGISIEGCGCCGSPYLSELEPDYWHHAKEEDFINVDDVVRSFNDPKIESEYDLTDEQKKQIGLKAILGNNES